MSQSIADMTGDLAGVDQRVMSPYSGDLAEWLCEAACQPCRVAGSHIMPMSSPAALITTHLIFRLHAGSLGSDMNLKQSPMNPKTT